MLIIFFRSLFYLHIEKLKLISADKSDILLVYNLDLFFEEVIGQRKHLKAK